jgi:hypothetical protein
VSTDVSEEHIASIFRVEKISSARNQRESRWQRWFLAEPFFSTLKMKAICSSETSVDTQRTTHIYQKMVLFITTAVRTSSATKGFSCAELIKHHTIKTYGGVEV